MSGDKSTADRDTLDLAAPAEPSRHKPNPQHTACAKGHTSTAPAERVHALQARAGAAPARY